MASGGDGGFGQTEVQEVGDGGERSVVAFHEARGVFFFRGVERDGSDFFIVGDAVDSGSDILGALEVAVGESDGIDLALAGHIVGCGGSHHAGTDDE
jgi:hypothetical protein